MADRVTAKATADKSFTPHPAGGHIIKCVDVVDYGLCVGDWQGQVKIQPKCGLFYQSGLKNEDGQLFTVSEEFTVSMSEKANLRKRLEGWRGKSYTEEQAMQGVPLDRMEGQYGYAMIEHRTSGSGRVYATIVTMMPVPAGLPLPTIPEYSRPEYVTKRKAEYAAELAKHRAIEDAAMPTGGAGPGKPGSAVTGAPNRDTSFDDFPEALDDDSSDLPF